MPSDILKSGFRSRDDGRTAIDSMLGILSREQVVTRPAQAQRLDDGYHKCRPGPFDLRKSCVLPGSVSRPVQLFWGCVDLLWFLYAEAATIWHVWWKDACLVALTAGEDPTSKSLRSCSQVNVKTRERHRPQR